jgi:glucan phosphorylase
VTAQARAAEAEAGTQALADALEAAHADVRAAQAAAAREADAAAAALEAFADDAEFRAQWREAKRQNKIDLAFHVLAATGVTIDPASLFDLMAKRLHEYKRQILKLLHGITVYNRIKADPAAAVTPCTVIFGAKATPGYGEGR